MTKRKDALRAMFESLEPAPANKGAVAEIPPRPATGAVKAIGLSLNKLACEADEARRLRESLVGDERVIELEPRLIQSSIITDRLNETLVHDAAFAALKTSMAENGQQVPILVRQHPEPQMAAKGWYQAAYGHRRIRAAKELGIPVKAIVRALDDRMLIVAQGNENADRRNLSYIERALFAGSMIARGFDRQTAQASLSVDKTELSRMLQVAGSVPEEVIKAIGPVPKAGRPRWLALGRLLTNEASLAKAADEMGSEGFHRADSNGRFQALYDVLTRKNRHAVKPGAKLIKDGEGRALARLSSSHNKTSIEIDGTDHKAFADFIAREIPNLAEAFKAANAGADTASPGL